MILALALSTIAAAVPTQVPHSGRLMDGGGLPLSNTHDLTFTLYDQAAGGTVLWTVTRTVDFDEGYFNVRLGELNPLDDAVFDGTSRFLALAVDGGADLPDRIRIDTVPYAFRANTATSVVGGTVDVSEISIDGNVVIDSSGTFLGSGGDGDTLGALTCGTGQVALYDGSDWTCSALDWSDLNNVPPELTDGDADTLATSACADGEILVYDTGLATPGWRCGVDLDTDTVLTEAEVDAFVGNNGYVTDWTNLPSIPSDIADGDDDTQLSEADVDAMVANNGYVTDWTNLPSIPSDIADGDDDTQLSEAQVEGFVTNGGIDLDATSTVGGLSFVTDWTNLPNIPSDIADGDDDTLAALSCAQGQLAVMGASGWMCADPSPPGLSANNPSTSCMQVLTDNPTASDGIYYLDTGAGSFPVYCDMTTDGGGWTLVWRHSYMESAVDVSTVLPGMTFFSSTLTACTALSNDGAGWCNVPNKLAIAADGNNEQRIMGSHVGQVIYDYYGPVNASLDTDWTGGYLGSSPTQLVDRCGGNVGVAPESVDPASSYAVPGITFDKANPGNPNGNCDSDRYNGGSPDCRWENCPIGGIYQLAGSNHTQMSLHMYVR